MASYCQEDWATDSKETVWVVNVAQIETLKQGVILCDSILETESVPSVSTQTWFSSAPKGQEEMVCARRLAAPNAVRVRQEEDPTLMEPTVFFAKITSTPRLVVVMNAQPQM